MRFVTWNVNSLRARMERLHELLERHQPDVVALQETKASPEQVPHLELAAAGYRTIDHSGGRWAGVALLVANRLEVDETSVVAGLPGSPLPDDARWVQATVDGVTVASVYIVNGRSPDDPMFATKLEWMTRMRAHMAGLVEGPALVGGDFNVALADEDVWNPPSFRNSTHVTPEERAHLEGMLDDGWIDTVRVLHPEGDQFTWWDYRAGSFHRNRGMRIDYVLASPAWEGRILEAGIDRDLRKGPKPSDHAPLIVDLD